MQVSFTCHQPNVKNTSASTQAIESKTPQNGGLLLNGRNILEPVFLPWNFSHLAYGNPIGHGWMVASWFHCMKQPCTKYVLKKLQFLWQGVESPWPWCFCSLFDYIRFCHVLKSQDPDTDTMLATIATSFTRCNHQGFDRAFGDWVQGAFWLLCSVPFFQRRIFAKLKNIGTWAGPSEWRGGTSSSVGMPAETAGEKTKLGFWYALVIQNIWYILQFTCISIGKCMFIVCNIDVHII